MRHLHARALQPLHDRLRQREQDLRGLGTVDLCGQPHRGIEPAEQSLAYAIARVVHRHHAGRAAAFRQDRFKPLVQPFAGLRRYGKNPASGIIRHQLPRELGQMRGGQQVGLVDDQHLRLLELLAVDVAHVLAEIPRAPAAAERLIRAPSVQQHRQRGQPQRQRIDARQRQQHRRHQVGAAPHRLRQKYVGPLCRRELLHRRHQLIQPAAKAAARDLRHRPRLLTGQRTVHQPRALVIRDEPAAQAPCPQPPHQPRDHRRLPRPQETAHQNKPRHRGGTIFVLHEIVLATGGGGTAQARKVSN